MKKNYNPISDVRNESIDLTKRLFRNIQDAVHNLDDVRARANNVCHLFTRAANTQRVRLKDCCERLIFCDLQSGYGRKAEELHWRKGYYEVISTAKRLKTESSAGWIPEEAAFIKHHVLAGIGQYHHLLSKLQFDFGLDLRGIIDNPVLFLDEGLVKGKNSSTGSGRNKVILCTNGSSNLDKSNGNLSWALNVAHRCLIYLGDLHRYLLDLQPGWDYGSPAHYYTQALILKPEAGMPFNQLGTLSGSQNHSLDAVYYYMRCMCCPFTFEGAEGNLIHALDKTAKLLESDNKEVTSVGRLISCILYLTRIWFFNKTSILPLHKVCDELLGELQKCFNEVNEKDPIKEAEEKLLEILNLEEFVSKKNNCNEQQKILSDDMLFKIVVILIMCMQHLNKKGSEEYMRAVALHLVFISQIIQQAIFIFEKCLPYPSPVEPEVLITEMNGLNGHSSKRRRRRRRRRRASSGGSSDLSEGDDTEYVSNSDSDISEEELVFDEQKSENESENEEDNVVNGIITNGNGVVGSNELDSNSENNIDIKSSSGNSDIEKRKSLWLTLDKNNESFLHVHDLMKRGFLLQTIKICFDWLFCNMDVLRTCSQGCKPLINRTAMFMNYLLQIPMPLNIKTDVNSSVTSTANSYDISSENHNSYSTKSSNFSNNLDYSGVSINIIYTNDIDESALPEDYLVRNLSIFSWAHSKLEWKKCMLQRLSSEQESYLRVNKLVHLGMKLANEKDMTSLAYDPVKNWFSNVIEDVQVDNIPLKNGKISSNLKANNKFKSGSSPIASLTKSKTAIEKQVDVSSKHDKLMQNMGQLWLKAEVKELETKVKKTGPNLPPYLVIDCDALIYNSPLIKQLATSKKFIIVIPNVVVSALDEQKRNSSRARDTIRWLENQFRHGNRFLRAQRINEHMTLPLIKYPKKKDREAWLFFQVVECCNFLNNQGGGKDSKLVTLLTGSSTLLNGNNSLGFSPLGVVSSAGINIEHIESFYGKWKSSYKSHG